MSPRTKAGIAAATLAAIGLAGYILSASFQGAASTAGAWPSASELDSLAQYLRAVRDTGASRLELARARLGGTAAGGPEAPQGWDELGPIEAPVEAHEPAAPRPRSAPARPVRRLSAILITGDRRVAIVDDLEVRPGDPLPGGAEVVSIEAEQVVVREADGARTVLRL